jgi:hypothetical protein
MKLEINVSFTTRRRSDRRAARQSTARPRIKTGPGPETAIRSIAIYQGIQQLINYISTLL